MRIVLLAFAVALAIGQTSPPVPRQATDTGAPNPQEHGQKTASNQQPESTVPVPRPSLGKDLPGSPSQNTAKQNKPQDDPTTVEITKFPTVSVERDWIDHTTLVIGTVLAVIGIIGVWAAFLTLRAIRRQVELQTLTMQQWVYLTGWEVKKLKNDPSKLRIRVNLVNQSGFPLTLSEGGILVEEIGGSIKHLIGEGTFLPPNTPMQIEIVVTPTPGQLPEFDKGSLSFRVTGDFSYIDRISGRRIEQLFNGRLACGYWGTIFRPELHMNPVESEPPKEAENKERPN